MTADGVSGPEPESPEMGGPVLALEIGVGLRCGCGRLFSGADIDALIAELEAGDDGDPYPGGWPECCGRPVAVVVPITRFTATYAGGGGES